MQPTTHPWTATIEILNLCRRPTRRGTKAGTIRFKPITRVASRLCQEVSHVGKQTGVNNANLIQLTSRATGDGTSLPVVTSHGRGQIPRIIAPIEGYITALPDSHQYGVNNNNIRRICLVPIAHQETRKATKLGLLNARSLRSNYNIICDYVLEHDIDIICLTETWLTPNDDIITQAIIPQGYIIEHIPRSTRRGGGVGVLFKNTLRLESAKMWHAESFECVEVELFGSSVASAVRLFVLYRPPSSGRLSKPFALFLQELGDLIIYATVKQAGLAILGDFNVPYGKANNKDAGDLATLISDSNLKQHVLSATHVRGNTLDLIITPAMASVITHVTVESLLSDHHVIVCRLKLPKPRPARKQITYRKHGAIDNALFSVICWHPRLFLLQ